MSVVYREYIASDVWRHKRVDALNRSGRKNPTTYVRAPRCEFCGQYGSSHKNSRSSLDYKDRQFRVEQSNGLHVHHVTYRRLGDEHPDDLIVLCTDVVYYARWSAQRHREQIPFPNRVGCHERVHDDPDFAVLIAHIAETRTY